MPIADLGKIMRAKSELTAAGALTANGYIIRPKLRAVVDRIIDNGGAWTTKGVVRADNFLLMLNRMSKKNGVSFDQYCEKLGY